MPTSRRPIASACSRTSITCYRYSALLDRLEGKDANNILQSYSDILPGRPTVVEHRAPEDDVRRPYDERLRCRSRSCTR